MAKATSKKAAPKKSPAPPAGTILAESPTAPFISGKDMSLEDLFLSELKDTYWAEQHLVKSLPKMIAATGSPELRTALTEHLEVTRTQVTRLEEVFTILGEKLVAKKCDAMEGLTMSGEHVIESTLNGSPVRDTGIIMSGLKVENFEITVYKGLIQVAQALKQPDIAALLQTSLDEETDAANTLDALAQEAVLEKN